MNSWRCKAVWTSWDLKCPSSRPHPVCYPQCHCMLQLTTPHWALRSIHPSRSTHGFYTQTSSSMIIKSISSPLKHHKREASVSRCPAPLPTTTSAGANWSAHHHPSLPRSAPDDHDHVCRIQRETTNGRLHISLMQSQAPLWSAMAHSHPASFKNHGSCI
jgi:hypothetical protein